MGTAAGRRRGLSEVLVIRSFRMSHDKPVRAVTASADGGVLALVGLTRIITLDATR
jgi:hypothetical protein